MRRSACLLALPLLALPLVALPLVAAAQQRPQSSARPPAGPPHAFLFGTWTGGLFPVLEGTLAQNCLSNPTVVFGKDAVAHGSLIGNTMSQRVIETVRVNPGGAEFRLTPDPADPQGFGCQNPNELTVQKLDDRHVAFPRCTAFPYPLERCPN